MNLLEAYIAAVIDSYLTEGVPAAFSIDHLKTLQDPRQVLEYVQQTLGSPMGEGQGRTVYRAGNGTVLKVARNSGGIAQNQTEIQACGSSDLFPRIMESSSEGFWLLAEEAEPMTRVKFRELTGIGWGEFISAVGGAYPKKLNKQKTSDGEIQNNRNNFEKHYSNAFFRKILNTVNDCGYEPGDLSKLDSWGVISGKPVIIDSGFTEAVQQSHYQGNK